jgi:cytochrome oxidase Cu insertion factor (SCO1/SenC/PrrC family)
MMSVRAIIVLALLAVWQPCLSAQPSQKSGQRPNREGSLKPGDPAPDFILKDVEGKSTVKLSDLRGKPAVLVFGSCT